MSRPEKPKFSTSEDGAVTVDWVVLCAGLAAMAALISQQMETGTTTVTDDLATHMGTLR